MSKKQSAGPYDTVATVVSQTSCGASAYLMTLHCPELARNARPPQFFTIACNPLQPTDNNAIPVDPILRRPLGFYRVRPEAGEFEMIYQVVGRGTRMLTMLKAGDRVRVLGPLGKYIDLKDVKSQTILLVGGGVGLPPLAFLAEALQKADREPIAVVGARGRDLLIAPVKEQTLRRPIDGRKVVQSFEPFVRNGIDCTIALEKPAAGFFEGLVTPLLEKYLAMDYEGGVEIITCGPLPMVRAVAKMAKEGSVKCTVIMESRMACGLGACQACVVKTTSGYRRACMEGPVFNAEEIIWE